MADEKGQILQFSRGAPGQPAVSSLKEGGGGGTSGGMEARVAKLEGEMVDVRIALARIDEKLNRLATKDDVSAVAIQVSAVKGELTGKLGYWQFVGTGLGLAGLLIAALALIIRPEFIKLLSGE